jgi:hypothetical protein
MYLPRVFHDETARLSTQISIQNSSDIMATAVVTYYHSSGSVAAVMSDNIAGHGFKRYASADVAALGTDWQGSVVVSADQPVAVEALHFLTRFPGPDIGVSPVWLETPLMPSRTTSLPLMIANYGGADLHWSLAQTVPAAWLSLSPTSGTTVPGTDSEVTVAFDATGLAEGVYTTAIRVTSDDPDTPLVTVQVWLRVQQFVFLPIAQRDWPPPLATLHLHGQDAAPGYLLSPDEVDGSRPIDGISNATE